MPRGTLPSVVTSTRDPLRRGFHGLLALGGWVVFLYLWWTIFARGLDRDGWIALLCVAILLCGIILLNTLWIRFNEGVARSRTPRTRVREVAWHLEEDKIGRRIQADWREVQEARSVWIEVEPETNRKLYRTVDA
jgi:hypothetical protein